MYSGTAKLIVIIDYGMGNTKSIESIIQHLHEDVCISRDKAIINSASHLILPGVGSFDRAMKNLQELDLINSIKHHSDKNKPILGICLGMQLLAKSSTEGGLNLGLGYINCTLDKFLKPQENTIKIPHVGYNSIDIIPQSKLLQGLDQNSDFYFTHSYKMQCIDDNIVSSRCTHGETFVASIEHDNLFGTQFHPELSQKNGIKLLSNFINWQIQHRSA